MQGIFLAIQKQALNETRVTKQRSKSYFTDFNKRFSYIRKKRKDINVLLGYCSDNIHRKSL